MGKVKIGDKMINWPGMPTIVEVSELGTCEDANCKLGKAVFRYKNPEGGVSDWMHVSEFEKVG